MRWRIMISTRTGAGVHRRTGRMASQTGQRPCGTESIDHSAGRQVDRGTSCARPPSIPHRRQGSSAGSATRMSSVSSVPSVLLGAIGQHQQEGEERKRDDDRRQDQRLRQRIGGSARQRIAAAAMIGGDVACRAGRR